MSTKKFNNPWRYCCPEGHTNWVSTGTGYYCESCKQHSDSDGVFDELVDMKDQPLRY